MTKTVSILHIYVIAHEAKQYFSLMQRS